jgi:hypothetical protein
VQRCPRDPRFQADRPRSSCSRNLPFEFCYISSLIDMRRIMALVGDLQPVCMKMCLLLCLSRSSADPQKQGPGHSECIGRTTSSTARQARVSHPCMPFHVCALLCKTSGFTARQPRGARQCKGARRKATRATGQGRLPDSRMSFLLPPSPYHRCRTTSQNLPRPAGETVCPWHTFIPSQLSRHLHDNHKHFTRV